MMLIEQTSVPSSALPVQEFKDHLRLGTGFADDGVQDALAEGYLRAAMAAIEGRIGKVLVSRDFLMSLGRWRDDQAQPFPVAPVSAIASITVLDRDGVATPIAANRYGLQRDTHRPKIVAGGARCRAFRPAGRRRLSLLPASARSGPMCRSIWRRRSSCWRRSSMRIGTRRGIGRRFCHLG